MFGLLLTSAMYVIPLLLITVPFLLLFDVSPKWRRKPARSTVRKTAEPHRPDIAELELKLTQLLKDNQDIVQIDALRQKLQSTSTANTAAYLRLNKNSLKGFHLFQLIFSLIKNRAEDKKILKMLRHYLPSCATSHLQALLRSFKIFLDVSAADGRQKELLRDLNENRLRSTLLYLEQKMNRILNQIAALPPAMQQLMIDRAVAYGLVFAAFSEFYDTPATEKVLRLSYQLSPELFRYWHTFPAAEAEYTNIPERFLPLFKRQDERRN